MSTPNEKRKASFEPGSAPPKKLALLAGGVPDSPAQVPHSSHMARHLENRPHHRALPTAASVGALVYEHQHAAASEHQPANIARAEAARAGRCQAAGANHLCTRCT